MRRLLFLIALLATPALAQETPKPVGKQPIEVTADQSLEWYRDSKIYIARTNAIAKQGTSEIHGDTLTAKYTEGPDGKGTNINRIDAVGNVSIISDASHATGDRGYYDVATGYSELTGHNLLLKTPTDTITARDKLTYDAKQNEMNAYGNALAVRGEDTISADRLIGRFVKDATGGTKMREMEAIGGVVVTTPSDVMHGDRGIYHTDTNKATMTGHVRIDRGPNVITGARGEVDMNTNISRIFGADTPTTETQSNTGTPLAPGEDGRVRGVFYPE